MELKACFSVQNMFLGTVCGDWGCISMRVEMNMFTKVFVLMSSNSGKKYAKLQFSLVYFV